MSERSDAIASIIGIIITTTGIIYGVNQIKIINNQKRSKEIKPSALEYKLQEKDIITSEQESNKFYEAGERKAYLEINNKPIGG